MRSSANSRDGERNAIIDDARRLAHAGGCPAEVTRRLAKRMGRSVETIRYTLKQFDQEHPDLAIFPESTGPLTEDDKKKIYQQYRRGVSVETLAKRYCRTKTSIYRDHQRDAGQADLELPLDFIPNPEFARADAEKKILVEMPQPEAAARRRLACRAACRPIWPACTKCRC